jgi:signal transduction histidine kinase
MISSTQRQVTVLVAASVLLAFLLNYFFLVSVMRTLGEVPERVPERGPLRVVAGLYQANAAWRPELLRQAAASGLRLHEIPDRVVQACERAKPACPAAEYSPSMPRVRVGPDMWLGVEPHAPPPGGGHGPHFPTMALFALVGLPTLAISLWASRGVTAPLERLTAQAENVDPETVEAPLPVTGTTEIRLLAEAFNRLILRLTRYAADQRRMLAAVSHDLRTPLTRMRLRAETIGDAGTRDKMVRDVQAMQVLIDRALALLQMQDGAARPVDTQASRSRVDLPALLQAVADDMADAGVPVTLGKLAPVSAVCDPQMLTRAVENLLENAAKYGGGGTLSVRAGSAEAVIEVADTGPGLSDADKARAFDPWFRGDSARGGLGHGLGLAIVRAVMAALGGRVELADAMPHGLVARLVLPT